MVMAHRLTRRVLVVALPLAVLVICDDGHPLPLPSTGNSIIPPPATGAAAPLSPVESRRQSDALRLDVLKIYGHLPLQFETNLGQTDPRVKFFARGARYTVFLTPSETVLVLRSPQPSGQPPGPGIARLDRRARGPRESATVMRFSLAGANPDPRVVGLAPLPGKANYFIGNDPHKWRTGIPTYAKVAYRDVYPGIDVVYYGAQRQLEYDFIVAPGADPAQIRLAVTGAEALGVDEAGDLVLRTAGGTLKLNKPLIYQETGGKKQQIAGGYVLLDKDRVGFRVAAYDAGKPLVIDPVLSYSTYLGGSNDDFGWAIAVDSAGNAYVTGGTHSPDFPTANALQPTLGETSDAIVVKINSAGSAFVYSTYLGGQTAGDAGWAIAVDSAGNAYVSGATSASDFPTVNALQPMLRGYGDAFVAKLDAAGSALVYSTYLGGSDFCDEFGECHWEDGLGIAVDADGNAYVVGTTYSSDFPTVNALQPALRGYRDAFVAKLNPAGSALVYSTYLGGSDVVTPICDEEGFCYYARSGDYGSGIAVDSAGNAYVTGTTPSSDFPTANALQPALAGDSDAFVAKLNPAGTALAYSTFLGGSSSEEGRGIAVDSEGNAYVTGTSYSSDFPTVNAAQPALAVSPDAFVTKLNAAGSALVYSTYLGGSVGDSGYGIALDSAGNAYVTGTTDSYDFPTASALQPMLRGSWDAFVTKLNAAGSALVYSTYLGGSNTTDLGLGIAVDSAGNAYVTGITYSSDFPMMNALQPTRRGYQDGFVAKISPITTQPPVASFASACRGLTCSFDGSASSDPDGTITGYSWNFGDGTTGTGPTVSHTYAAAATYAVMLTVTDNAGATGTHSKSVTAGQTHVGDLDGASTIQRSTWTAIVMITVHDSSHQLVANATVSGSWSGGGGTGSCTTNGSGQCTVSKSLIPKRNASVTFAGVNITHATLTYASTDNHDPDGDSNGSSITVSRR
jgi:PKD domain/Beta-propeller repeat